MANRHAPQRSAVRMLRWATTGLDIAFPLFWRAEATRIFCSPAGQFCPHHQHIVGACSGTIAALTFQMRRARKGQQTSCRKAAIGLLDMTTSKQLISVRRPVPAALILLYRRRYLCALTHEDDGPRKTLQTFSARRNIFMRTRTADWFCALHIARARNPWKNKKYLRRLAVDLS